MEDLSIIIRLCRYYSKSVTDFFDNSQSIEKWSGNMAVQVYINFNGECREAVEFYAAAFQTKEPQFMTFGDGPENPDFPLTEEDKKRIMHTELEVSGDTIMFSDILTNMDMVVGTNISLTVVMEEEEEIRRIFHILSEGGNIVMPLQQTFWTSCYGNLYDKYGIGWQFSCAAPKE